MRTVQGQLQSILVKLSIHRIKEYNARTEPEFLEFTGEKRHEHTAATNARLTSEPRD